MNTELRKRVITAFFFVATVLAGLYGGRWAFVGLMSLIAALCIWEFLGLTLTKGSGPTHLFRRIFGVIIGLLPVIFVSLSMMYKESMPSPGELVIYVLPLFFLLFIFELFSHSESPFQNVAFVVLGLVYIGCSVASLDYIAFVYYPEQFFPHIILGILMISWANDTGAYFAGSTFGKHKLFERISPKKTWEGFAGGAILALLIAFGLSQFFVELSVSQWLMLGVVVIVFGTLGDLIESRLKRSLGIKDSGNILPGHGGVLDRFDALIFLMPFATLYLYLIR